jgi:hypothetical protein
MPDEVVTLWRYRDLPEALIASCKLQSAGIECSLADKEIVRLDWFWSNMVGGVRLRLNETDAEDALGVLADEIPASFSAEDVGEEYVQPRCPNCQSRDVSFERFDRAWPRYFWGWGWFPRVLLCRCGFHASSAGNVKIVYIAGRRTTSSL